LAPHVEVGFTPNFQSRVKNSAEAFVATPAASLEVFWPMPAVAGLAECISITIFHLSIRIAWDTATCGVESSKSESDWAN
jgi:hypothetical protein